MVESIMVVPVVFECGLKVRGIDRRHLMRRPTLADPRQVNEGSDPTPRQPEDALDRVLVVVDAVAPWRLRRIDAGQFEGREEVDDGMRGPVSHDRCPKERLSTSSTGKGPWRCARLSAEGKKPGLRRPASLEI